MPEATARRSLAARRRATNALDFDDFDEKENSLDETTNGRRTSRLLNGSFSAPDEPIQTPRQLVDLYQKTVELATQGKINIKNAFSIPLVERLPQILHVIALDDEENHHLGPNFVKAGSVIDTSAKIYGYRVDALHTETQKLSGNFLQNENENENEIVVEETAKDENEIEEIPKKIVRRVKAKTTSFIVGDPSKITLEHEFEFRPLQSPSLCQWRGGVGKDSIYAEMVSSTMYSSSDVPMLDAFLQTENHDEISMQPIDLKSLRNVMKTKDGQDHLLGNASLREFVFNENPTDSMINTIHESRIDDEQEEEIYSQDELIDAAIQDFNEEPSHTNEIFRNALNELNEQPIVYPSQQSSLGQAEFFHQSSSVDLLSTSTMSFADQMPNLLNSKCEKSDYSYFDANKLKLFAGPNIWKFTNLLHQPNDEVSSIQQKQAPVTPHKIRHVIRETNGVKRAVRVEILRIENSIDDIMTLAREKRNVASSQSSLLLRQREKTNNQMQLARKIRPLNELTNFHHFPDLNVEHLERVRRHEEPFVDPIQTFDDPIENDFDEPIHYEFIRPIHYEKIEFAKGSTAVNAKILKRQIIEEFTKQKIEIQRTFSSSLDTTNGSEQQTPVEFSILCENLVDHGHLSLETDLASAFYCMLINCNEKKLYMKSNWQRDDLFIQEQPFVQQNNNTLSYSYVSHSNLSLVH